MSSPSQLRLDWVSPLPPERSGIADYSADLLPHVAARADVRVIRLPGQAVGPGIESRWRPVALERLGEDGRLPVYQMGNNRLHDAVDRAARRLPGVVVLHDVVLHHLLLDQTLGRGDWDGYLERLTADHGWIGEAVVRGFGWGAYGDAAQFALPAHRTLLEAQRGVIVHSQWAADLVREELPAARLRVVPMAVPLPPPADRAAGARWRDRLGIPPRAVLLGSFGFQTPMKRTEVAIRALAAPGLEEAHLLIGGEVSAPLDFAATAAAAGVAARVHHLGFLDFSELESAVAACDLCLNLRYPTAGETSASLLRVLALGRPVVVSAFAQFRDLPAGLAVRAPLVDGAAQEARALAAVVAEALRDRPALERRGEEARAWVAREHDPETAATALLAAAAEFLALPVASSAGLALAPPPSSWVWQPLEGDLEVEGVENWRPGERRRLRVRLRNTGRACWRAGTDPFGGIALDVRFLDPSGANLRRSTAWLPATREIGPGESVEWQVDLRRPAGDQEAGALRLIVEPQVFGRGRMAQVGGPVWEAAI